MKGLQKKILIVLFVCIALFAFSAVGFAKTTDENGLDVQNFEYSLSAENKIHLQTVDGKNYLFLPASESDFDIRKLECGDLKPVWDGLKEEEKGKEKLKIDLIEPGAGSDRGGKAGAERIFHPRPGSNGNERVRFLPERRADQTGRKNVKGGESRWHRNRAGRRPSKNR